MKQAPADKGPAFVVGIGSSAGGLEALRALIGNLPTDTNVSVLIAQHMSPQHRSLLSELLGRETELGLVEAKGGETLAPNQIYICPPNADLTLSGNRLKVATAPRSVGPKPSIDVLFNSIADGFGERAVGIILSGTGSDGAHGSRAIRAAGGLTIAQDPTTAQYDSMPRAAIALGGAELVLPPQTIGKHLAALLSTPRTESPTGGMVMDSEASPLADVINGVWQRQRLDFSQYKEPTIRRQLDRRIAALQIRDAGVYADYVKQHPEELDELAKSFLISVTAFFRDKEAFASFAQVIEQIVAGKNQGDPIRVWVPGCATGEEAYSIAILIHEAIGAQAKRGTVQVFGTDIDTDATTHARRGLYSRASLEGVDPVRIKRYFTVNGTGYQLDKRIQEMVVFARQDLIRDPPFLRLDLISCRNVLIYFKPELQEHLFQVFHYALNSGGTLFLGKSEAVTGKSGLFTQKRKPGRVFVRNDLATPPLRLALLRPNLEITSTSRAGAKAAPPDPKQLLRDRLAHLYAPPSALMDAGGKLVELIGEVTPYFALNEGAADLDVLRLIRPELRTELRALIHRAQHSEAREAAGQLLAAAKWDKPFRMRVRRLGEAHGSNALVLSFEPEPESSHTAAPTDVDGDGALTVDNQLMELQHELASTREHLQTVIEELETSNEELQSLNEELQASGEELQASNEELATSNEELQATNEELTTVNDELQVKSTELADALANLESIQDSTAVAIVVVNRDLLVTRFNAPAVRIFGLTDKDLGRNLATLPTRLAIPSIHERLKATLTERPTQPEEVRDGSSTYRVETAPYRDSRGDISGAVLSLADISALKHTESSLRETQDIFRILTDGMDAVIWIQEPGFGRMIYVSPAYRRIFGLDPEMVLRDPEHMCKVMHREDAKHLREAFATRRGEPFSLRVRITHPSDGSLRWLYVRAFPVREGERLSHYAGLTLDITKDINDASRIENLEHLFDLLLDAAADGVIGVDGDGSVLFANRAARRLCGTRDEQLIGSAVAPYLEPAVAAAVREALHNTGGATRRVIRGTTIAASENLRHPVDIVVSSEALLRGERAAAVLVLRDSSGGEAAARKLRLAASVFNNSQQGILVLDGESRAIAANPALERMLGVESRALLGQVPAFLRINNPHSAFSQPVWDALKEQGRWSGEVRTQRADDGEFVVLEVGVSALEPSRGDDEGRYLLMVSDITQRRADEAIIYQQANYDSLTGLPNRSLLLDRLELEISHAERDGTGITLMFIDLDRFKEVNDSLGHDMGDLLLSMAALRIKSAVRSSDTLCRFGGDEFVLMLPRYHRVQGPELIARTLLERLEESFDLDGREVYISASIGIAVYPQDATVGRELLRNADAAMYEAKKAGRKGFAFYQPQLNRDALRRMTMEAELRQAIKNRELSAFYQPIIHARSGRVCALEALARWHHGTLGLLPPSHFIPYAEEAGLMDAISDAVLTDVEEQLARWRAEYEPDFRIAVNICPQQFRQEGFRQMIGAHFDDLSGVIVEVTESLFVDYRQQRVLDNLVWLRERGALIALDDFGTGYSSLSHVRGFPVDVVKIDREFVADAPDNPRDVALVKAAVAMAHGIGASIVAEGVETERQAEAMRELDADHLQGFLFSEPLPADEVTRYIAEHPPASVDLPTPAL